MAWFSQRIYSHIRLDMEKSEWSEFSERLLDLVKEFAISFSAEDQPQETLDVARNLLQNPG